MEDLSGVTAVEVEEAIEIRKLDGSRPTVDEMVAALFKPVKVVEDSTA